MAYHHILVALLSLTFHILITTSFTNATGPVKLALKLIHRRSIFSPSYSLDDDIRAPVLPTQDGTIFLVNISIGEPPLPQLMAMDTGSQLVWVHCTQCEGCYNVYDPTKSSTFAKLPAYSRECTNFDYPDCMYEIRYEDQSTSNGFLASEKFTFLTSSGGIVEVSDVVFGCALQTSGTVLDLNGVLGLEAPNNYYFAARTGNKFSYCIGNISDTQYAYNQLILGDGAIIEGDSTPMRVVNQNYAVTLVGISVGDKQLVINQDEFYYNVVIDSATTYSQLKTSAYEPLMAEVKSLMDGLLKPAKVRNGENQLCYSGDLERDLKGFPIVTLHLAEGTDIYLDIEAMFQRTGDGSAFCMAVVESSDNMIGVMAQQFYNVGFDLNVNRVSFQRIDCELLES